MSRTSRSILLVPILAAAVLGTGCNALVPGSGSGTGSGTSGAPAAPAGDDPVAWVDQVCGSLIPMAETATGQPALDTSGDTQKLFDGLGTYLGAVSTAADTGLQRLEAVGASPVEGGDKIVTDLRTSLTKFKDTAAEVKGDLEGIDTSDPRSIADVTQALEPFESLSELPDPTEALEANPELKAAADQAPNCRTVREAGRNG